VSIIILCDCTVVVVRQLTTVDVSFAKQIVYIN
jgi:hypothetical protein